MPVWVPPPADITRVVALAKKAGGDDAQLVENHLFWALYNRSTGLYSDAPSARAEWLRAIRFTRRLRRRQWIERFFRIRREDGTLGPLILNPAQRRLETWMLRMERARVPVRIQILKARKQGFCLDPTTRILTADMRWIALDDVHVGDRLVGVDESIPGGKGPSRRMLPAVVEAKREIMADAYRITFEGGSVIATGEHRFLYRVASQSQWLWRTVSKMKVGSHLRPITMPWGASDLSDAWYGGLLDGEGCMRSVNRSGCELNVTQNPGAVMDGAVAYLTKRGYAFKFTARGSSSGIAGKVALTRMDEVMRLCGTARPIRFTQREWWDGKELPGKRCGVHLGKILSIEPVGKRRMIDLQTTTKTFVAEGVVSHNSTLIQAYMFERCMREQHFEGLIVANNKDLAEKLVRMAEIARKQMPKEGEAKWDFKMKSTARTGLMWSDPMDSVLRITSAEVDEPARGGTPSMIHATETAFWKDAARKQPAVFSSLPALPGTYAFDESTANGQGNQYCNDFWKAWGQRDVPLHERENPWNAVFFGWFEHPSYRYSLSYGAGRTEPINLGAIRDQEERWLLTQKYLQRWSPDSKWEQVEFSEVEEIDIDRTGKIVGTYVVKRSGKKWRRKGVGWRLVDHDQLMWRRTKIQDKDCGGDINKFNTEYPSRPEVAFTSSGTPLFDEATLDAALVRARARKPEFVGTMSAPGSKFRTVEQILDDGPDGNPEDAT